MVISSIETFSVPTCVSDKAALQTLFDALKGYAVGENNYVNELKK